MMKKEAARERVREFLDLVENDKVDLRRYSRPVLVYKVDDGTVCYSIWEEDLLNRFGLQYVDGWDYEEDELFCPDWVSDHEDLEDYEDEDDEFTDLEDDDFCEPKK
jgi:hypothetical protein